METMGQNFAERNSLIAALCAYQINHKIILNKFPHYLAAYAARGELTGDLAVFAAADGDGGKFPMAIVHCLENGVSFSADGGGKGCVFNIAALVYRAVFTQKGRTNAVAGVGAVSL